MLGTKRAVLVDVDGIFIELVDHFGEYGVSPRVEEEIKVIGGLGEPLTELEKLDYLIIGHTNQPDISRGKITEEFLHKKHELIRGFYPQIKEFFVCPHTETDLCYCRKPKPGLLRQAGKKYAIDFSLSWAIGDSRGDVEAGCMVHARTIFVQTKYNCADPAIDKATAIAKSTKGALQLIAALATGTTNKHDS